MAAARTRSTRPEPLDDVFVFRAPDLLAKDEWLADGNLPLFTTPHFDGWPGVLLSARDLEHVPASGCARSKSRPGRRRRQSGWLARQRGETSA